MNAIAELASLLAPTARLGDAVAAAVPAAVGNDIAARTAESGFADGAERAAEAGIDAVIARLAQRVRAGSAVRVPEDLQRDAVARFWRVPRLVTLRDARLVAFGLGLPAGPSGRCLLDDRLRLTALLDGIDQWVDQPRWYRRCYQGLLRSYFNLDPGRGGSPERRDERRENWVHLRSYLDRRATRTLDRQNNPDWVRTLIAGRHLLGEAPCEPYVGALLQQRREALDAVCAQLGIDGSSWFLRQLVGAQVAAAVRLDDAAFVALLPTLLGALDSAPPLRDAGLAALLERHAAVVQAPLHAGLRDAAASWWGSPSQGAHAWHWNGLTDAARTMADGWLKADLIDGFFGATGPDADPRRAAFWRRYLRSIGRIELALGRAALQAANADGDPRRGLVALLRDAAVPADRAMIFSIGCARVVAFADPALPLHVYDSRNFHDRRQGAPFDTGRPVALAEDADNSLRHAGAVLLWHRDGVEGWRQWEQRVEAALKERFDIRPGAAAPADAGGFIDLSERSPAGGAVADRTDDTRRWHVPSPGEDVHWQTAEAASVPYSRPDLEVFARVHALRLDDRAAAGGKLWVLTDASDDRIARVLARWGFRHVADRGWSR